VVDGKVDRGHTFAFLPVCFFLGFCSFSAGMVKGKKVERKVTKFELYSGFRMSDEPVVR
jgi:hypothetical protein